jgi:hypothetical protein
VPAYEVEEGESMLRRRKVWNGVGGNDPAEPARALTAPRRCVWWMRSPISGPTRRSTKGNWTDAEDEILRRAVHEYKGKHWKKVGA